MAPGGIWTERAEPRRGYLRANPRSDAFGDFALTNRLPSLE